MSLGVRRDAPATALRSGPSDAPDVPSATRARPPGWRDPRLWVGLLIVTLSVVGGARLLAAADDTVAVWAVAVDAGPGATLGESDLVARQVRFGDAAALSGYWRTDETLPGELRLLRAVGAGELLPRGAIDAADREPGTVELPVAVDVDRVPPSVGAGSVVDVYLVTGSGDRRSAGDAGPVLREVTVVDAPATDAGFGSSGARRQLVLVVPEADAESYFAAVSGLTDPTVTVVRRG